MFGYILWGLIILIVFLLIKRIFAGIVLGIMYVLLIFFAVFLLDTVTTFPLRNIITLQWYDDAVEDPQGAVSGVIDKTKDVGDKVVKNVNESGKRLDVKYGSEYDKEWTLEDEKEHKEVDEELETKIETKTETKEEIQEGKKEEEVTKGINKEGEIYVKYEDVKKELGSKLKDLPEGDKEIIKAMTSVYKTRLYGETIEVWNTGETGGEGINIKIK